MKDLFSGAAPSSLVGPYSHGAAVSPNDILELPNVTRAIYVGGAGDLVIETTDGSVLTFKAVPVGTVLPVRANKVRATNTTATQLVALW